MAKILIIRLTSLGDVIFTFPLVHYLKKNGFDVDFLVSEKGYSIVKTNPDISKTILLPILKWKREGFKFGEFKNIISNLRKENYDIALDCQQMFKSILPFMLCKAKRRITFSDARELSKFAGNEFVKPKTKFRDYNYHMVERNLDFARYLGLNIDKIEFPAPNIDNDTKTKADELLKDIDTSKKTVVISPETTWDNKHWSIENWQEVIENLKDRVNILFTGTNQKLISKFSEYGIDLSGKTNLIELLEIFKRADLVISPDSGSSNLAWYSSVPSIITIFTCTPSKKFGPYGNDKKYFSIQGNLKCQPCFKKKCINKTMRCVKTPAPDEIIKIVNEILF